MPRYFFDIVDGEVLRDDVGVELEDLDEARTQAVIILAGALMPKDADKTLRGGGWRIGVRDDGGRLLLALEYRPGVAP